jgi:hypothetical protein
MRLLSAVLFSVVLSLGFAMPAAAQSTAPAVTAPRLINVSGVFQPADGQPPAPVETVTVSVYADAEGGAALWQETQTVAIDQSGRYTLLLGATLPDGVPVEVFASGDAQWLGTRFARAGEVEGPRVRLTSVPYAVRAANADTLGGLPASAYVLAPPASGGDQSPTSTTVVAGQGDFGAQTVLPGTPNFLAKYVTGTEVASSSVYETPGSNNVGIGTTTPIDSLHVRYTNTDGSRTGFAVQNLGNTATSYSGMLFYDQFGNLGQFQGFNNVTHEYRINNIARNSGTNQFDGSINFMIGAVSRFLVASSGNIGIGTTTPSAGLDVSNALTGSNTATVNLSTFSNSASGSQIIGRKARGTSAAPAAVLNADTLALFGARGYGATNFGTVGAGIGMSASENWTDAAQGTVMHFVTTANGTTAPFIRMTLDPVGNLGIGTGAPAGALEASRTGDSEIVTTSFGGGSGFLTRLARGTSVTPLAVQAGDEIGSFVSAGYGATGFSGPRAGMAALAAQNWTDAAQGSALVWGVTALGSTSAPTAMMGLLPSGNVGIGTTPDGNGLPTATERLQVFGDIRVGTTGTNGCIKNFASAGIVGTCSSDRRFKRDITPFSPVLNQLTALQPVHYFWRAAEFPDRHFGPDQVYGLIAQDVEQVLPEIVVTERDGYKAVDYSKLPLLTIQAVKELKAENDELKRRLTELERLVQDLLATPRK